MANRSDIVPQNIQEAGSEQMFLAPAPFQTPFVIPHYSPQFMLTYSTLMHVQVNFYF